MLDPSKTLALAEQVAQVAASFGIPAALTGAAALAVHGYVRGTEHLDLAVAVPLDGLRQLLTVSKAAGLGARLRLPGDEDRLGGVLVVWASEDDEGNPTDVVQVVNFLHPQSQKTNPATEAIARAVPLDGLHLSCVAMGDLVALKLYAGSRSDLADIVELLAHNPDTDLDVVGSIVGRFDQVNRLEDMVTEAAMRTMRRR